MIDLTRRKFIVGLGLIGIAPAIVKASSIMRVHEPKTIPFVFTQNTHELIFGYDARMLLLPGPITATDVDYHATDFMKRLASMPLDMRSIDWAKVQKMSDALVPPERKWFSPG